MKMFAERSTVLLLPLLAMFFLASCPTQEQTDQGGSVAEGSSRQTAHSRSAAGKTESPNLFSNTPMAKHPPNNLCLNRAGDLLVANVVPFGDDRYHRAVGFGLQTDSLSDSITLYSEQQNGKAYLSIHPDEPRCLLVRNITNSSGEVIDLILEGEENKSPLPIRFEVAQGIPEDGPFDNFIGIKPFYSWDGSRIIMPLTGTGMVIMDYESRQREYIAYPELDFEKSGQSIRAIEDQNDRHRLFLSFWQAGLSSDQCSIFTFDLDSGEYTHIADLSWIVYQAGCRDYDNEPWLIAGSRGKQDVTEITRTPILAYLDTSGSNEFNLVELHGEPLWQIELDARGDHAVYLDKLRKRLVKLAPETGSVEFDSGIYTDDVNAQILISYDAEVALMWDKRELLRASWKSDQD